MAVVEDADLSRPIAGARVRYEAVTGAASFADPVVVTNAAGEATVDVTAFSPAYCPVSVEAAGAAEHAFFEVGTEGVVDPSLADATLRDTAAHEVGHALGLAHTMGDQKNLMVDRGLSGGELTDAQCKTVQQNLGDFGG